MENIIGVKQLREQLPKIAQAAKRGQSFLVMRHHETLFRIEPPTPQRSSQSLNTGERLIKAFKHLKFSGSKNLSKQIDHIVYGI